MHAPLRHCNPPMRPSVPHPGWILRRLPLALEAGASLTVASAAMRLLSKRRVMRLLGVRTAPAPDLIALPAAQAKRVASAVERVAAYLPWHPACLAQAIATRWMLRRRGIPCDVHLGIVGTEPFGAHAWITVRGAVVLGGPTGQVTEILTLR